ncbi:hypothetical protein KCU61_g639, partial [Aureobasidium melanogenum]
MRQLRDHGASGGVVQTAIPIDSFVQPHVNGTGPSNAVECDGHGIGICRTCMVSLIASDRFAAGLMSDNVRSSRGVGNLNLTRDLEIETALAVSHNDEHFISRWTCIPWNQILGTDGLKSQDSARHLSPRFQTLVPSLSIVHSQ